MNVLTRPEEYVLISVWSLKDEAYSMALQRMIQEISGETWSLGAIYAPLERLEKRGFIVSSFSENLPTRRGRKRRIYQITDAGKEALTHLKSVHDAFWNDLPRLSLESL